MIATNPISDGSAKPITNLEDILDSRDILERIEYLEAEMKKNVFIDHCYGKDQFELEELETLNSLLQRVQLYSGVRPEDGALLIRDSYFTEYAKERAYKDGLYGRDSRWPLFYIDWERAANGLKMNYAQIYFDGIEYWIVC